jgi:FkbM family methyltransferase
MKRLLKRALAGLGYRIEGTRYVPRHLLEPASLRTLEFDDVICRLMVDRGLALTFVQIGAFDGVTRDPLRQYIDKCGWRGVLVEPQPGPAQALRDLYRHNDRVVVFQGAVAAEAGIRTLHNVTSDTVPQWAMGLASFDRNSITKHAHLIPGLEQMIGQDSVECVPFEHVLGLLDSPTLDLLQMDAEGADAYLLSLFPFDRVRPAIVHWEIKHADKQTREECFDRLVTAGYRLAPSGDEDMMAVLV